MTLFYLQLKNYFWWQELINEKAPDEVYTKETLIILIKWKNDPRLVLWFGLLVKIFV